ncbi:MAG TPA: bifunctional DNA-formamidopyrimidine glycosylase/DNA-(apurinic or apyrimidinic site) lyase [Smithellaceae bacterium]|nr:bifunctional DNA-formamidopyrimidine glycosylase/DNA-(apurinic or apyrimidinic site) lyase [Smithellaceae bacterium]
MPELPEVETLCRQLRRKIRGRQIKACAVYDEKLSGIKNQAGRTVTDVKRTGKMLEIALDNGEAIYIHLRMTGRLLWQDDCSLPPHTRWKAAFPHGNVVLIDPRRFATVNVLVKSPVPGNLDIFRSFDLTAFIAKNGRRKTTIKALLMDQNAVSGIGNIYACEILHQTGINPEKPPSDLQKADWEKLFTAAARILKKAIACRGTSVSDWRDLTGRKGVNQHELKVYGREGLPCFNCGTVIRRKKQNGRSTFFCPRCQK